MQCFTFAKLKAKHRTPIFSFHSIYKINDTALSFQLLIQYNFNHRPSAKLCITRCRYNATLNIIEHFVPIIQYYAINFIRFPFTTKTQFENHNNSTFQTQLHHNFTLTITPFFNSSKETINQDLLKFRNSFR